MSAPAPAPSAPRPTWPRFVLLGAAVLVAVGVAGLLFGPSLLVSYWINGLNSDDPVARKQCETKLLESDVEGVDAKLRAAVEDDGRTFRLRDACARLLYRRQRLTDLEAVLKEGSRTARCAVLSALADKQHFVSDYLADPSWRVRETLVEWLGDPADRARSRALQIVLMPGIELEAAMPAIRGMIGRRPGAGLPASEEQLQIVGAMEAAVRFRDCESVPAMLALVETDPNEVVRVNALQQLFDLGGGAEAPCAQALPADRLAALVRSALSSPSKLIRMGALTNLEKHQPAWTSDLRSRAFEILDGDGAGEERRAALGVLGLSRDEELRARLPRYFHDRAAGVRSTAVSVSQRFLAPPATTSGFEGCLIGTLRGETESDVAFQNALQALRRAAGGDWIGLTPELRRLAADRGRAFGDFLAEMFRTGQSRGLDRESWAKTWFRWHAGELGLPADRVDAALGAQDAFWRGARAADVAAARAALEAFGEAPPALFAYEHGWLAARTPPAGPGGSGTR